MGREELSDLLAFLELYGLFFFLKLHHVLAVALSWQRELKDLVRAKTCFSHTHLSTQRSQHVPQTRSGSYPGLNQALRMYIYMKDCDQVLGHLGNTIQGQAGWKFQRDHLLYTLNAEGWALVRGVHFPGGCQLSLGIWKQSTLWKSPRLLVLG